MRTEDGPRVTESRKGHSGKTPHRAAVCCVLKTLWSRYNNYKIALQR